MEYLWRYSTNKLIVLFSCGSNSITLFVFSLSVCSPKPQLRPGNLCYYRVNQKGNLMVHINKYNNSLEEFQLSYLLSVRQTECIMQYILFPTDHVCECAQVLMVLRLTQPTLTVGTLPHLEKIQFLYPIAPN
jgi:hypothetical protein